MTTLINIAGLQGSQAGAQTLSVARGFRVPGASTPAQVTIGTGNAALTYTAVAAGAAGNVVTVAYVVAGANTPLTVGVTGNAITVNVATTAGSAASSTAAQVRDAVRASGPASALLNVGLAPGSNGTGVVVAIGATSLAGGVNAGTSGTASGRSETVIQPGKIYQVDIDLDEVRRRLAKNFDRWVEAPHGSLQIFVRSLLAPSSADIGQSAISRGFRLPGQGIGFVGTDTSTDVSMANGQVADLTNPSIRRALRTHQGRYIVGNSTNTLVTVRGLATSNAAAGGGLSSRGFRIAKWGQQSTSAGASTVAVVTPTTSVQVDVSDWNVRRTLRRNYGRWVVVSTP